MAGPYLGATFVKVRRGKVLGEQADAASARVCALVISLGFYRRCIFFKEGWDRFLAAEGVIFVRLGRIGGAGKGIGSKGLET